MILMFAGIVIGIVTGVICSLLGIAMIRWQDEQPSEFDLDELMIDLEPDETPFTSVLQRHREAHLSARRDEDE